jgi:putative restriction endonuclease
MLEFDEIGRDAFLTRYGYRPARSFFVVHGGKRYDSKALAGVAVGKQFPALGPLAATEFSGGEATVKSKLESLGFHVISKHEDSENQSLEGKAWAEITSLEHGHAGQGWSLGHCLWSPTTAKDGSDRYSIMANPAAGDLVFHLVSDLSGEPAKRRFL